jgi:hypothetical protein
MVIPSPQTPPSVDGLRGDGQIQFPPLLLHFSGGVTGLRNRKVFEVTRARFSAKASSRRSKQKNEAGRSVVATWVLAVL